MRGGQPPRENGGCIMTEEEKKEYRENLTQQCKKYCHIDYDDDIDIVELMINTTLEEMQELIPNFDAYKMTSRQRLIALVSVKNLYDNREKYGESKQLSSAVSSMLLKEIYGGAAVAGGQD